MLTKVPITMQLKPQKMININIKGVLQMCPEKTTKDGGKKYYQINP
jgi:hypothetical protein